MTAIAKDLSIVLILAAFLCIAAIGAGYMLRQKMGRDSDLWLLSIPCMAAFILFFQPILLEDNLSYISYVRTMFMDGDLNIWNEYFLLNADNIYTYDPREPLGPTGCAIFIAPFFFMGHLLALFLNKIGVFFPLNGFSFPYIFSTALGGFTYSLFSLFFMYSMCRDFASRTVSLWAVLLILFGTNLFMMTYMWTGSTYPPSLFLFSAFLLLWHRTRQNRRVAHWLLLGLTGGLMTQVRFQNGFLLIIPALESVRMIFGHIRLRKWDKLKRLLPCLLLFLIFVLIGFSPQLVTWKAVNGSWFIDLYEAGKGTFDSPIWQNIGAMLYSPGDEESYTGGLIWAMPVLIAAFAGLILFFRRDKEFTIYIFAALMLQFRIISSYDDWHGHLLFATPYLITCSPFFALGMAAFLEKIHPRKWFPLILVLGCIACLWNIRCILIQQIFEQSTYFPEDISFWEGLHRLIFLPSLKITDHMIKLSGNFGYFLRMLIHPFRVGEIGMIGNPLIILFMAISFICAVKAGVGAIRRNSGREWKRPVYTKTLVGTAVFILIFINGAIVYTAGRTDTQYDYFDHDIILDSYELMLQSTGPEKLPIHILFDETKKGDQLFLITFLKNAEGLQDGKAVAEVKITDSAGDEFTYLMRIGKDTADYMAERPESLMNMEYIKENAEIVHSWLIRDHSRYYYYGHAYLCRIPVPKSFDISAVKISYLESRGNLMLTHLRLYWSEKNSNAHRR